MKFMLVLILAIIVVFPQVCGTSQSVASANDVSSASFFGFRNSAEEAALETRFLAVPDPKLA